jgi:hypothetical protein
MATKVKRSQRVSDFAKHGMNYLFRRDQISPLERERNREKAWLKAHIDENGVLDAQKNKNVYFDSPIPGPGTVTYYGLTQRRIPGAEFMDTEEVKKFMTQVSTTPEKFDAELFSRVVYEKTVVVVDTEELYVLQQEGKITAKQLRALIKHEKDSYQLWPIEEPPVEEDDEEE